MANNDTGTKYASDELAFYGFPSIEVYLDYTYLPFRTFNRVNNIILRTHDFLIGLFELDKEEIFRWYQFEIKELTTENSSWIKLEFNFNFPEKFKSTSKLNKAIRRFAFVAGLFAVVISAQEIYLNTLKIENEKTKLEQSLPADTVKEGKRLNLNMQKLLVPKNQVYIASVKSDLEEAVKESNIRSLKINGQEIKRHAGGLPKGGSFDL